MDITVRNNPGAGSYDAVVDGQVVGMIVYGRRDDRMIIRHTIVEPEHRGKGVATTLVRETLDDLRDTGIRVSNYCGFIERFIDANPGYADVIDAGHPGHTLPNENHKAQELA